MKALFLHRAMIITLRTRVNWLAQDLDQTTKLLGTSGMLKRPVKTLMSQNGGRS
jgi:hypothetical protein